MQHDIYALRTRADEIIYIGRTTHLDDRITYHRSYQPWRAEIYTATVLATAATLPDACRVEGEAIERYRPRYNVNGNPDAARRRRQHSSVIRDLRLKAGMTQTELAKQVKMSPHGLCHIEQGRRAGTPAQLKALASVLDVPLLEIMNAADGAAA